MGRLTLVYSHPEHGEQSVELTEDRSYRIGSSPDNDVVIPQKDISRHHAILRVRQGAPHITDLNSKNGTFINGRRTASSGFRCGDTVYLSSLRLVVEEEGLGEHLTGPGDVRSIPRTEPDDTSEVTQAFTGQASAEEMVSLLVTTSGAVRRGAVGEPLAWAVEHFGLEAMVVLYRDEDDNVSMVSSAGDLGALVRSSDALTKIAREQKGSQSGTRITQLSELGESLLVAPVLDRHVLVVRFVGSPPAVGDVRAVIAAVEAVLGSGNPPHATAITPGDRRDPELRRFGSPLHRIAGLSDSINECKLRAAEVARSERSVVLVGEPGTGKSLFARVIHDLSTRREGPFALLEEPPADSDLDVIIAETAGGTLYVPNVSAASLEVQTALLDALNLTSAGSTATDVDVRPILGIVGDVQQACDEGRLHPELAVSLGGFRLTLPPLRDHTEDIPLLVTHFQREVGGRSGGAGGGFTVDALEALALYSWPGNVGELRAEVLRLMTRAASDMVVEVGDLSPRILEGLASEEVPAPDLGAMVTRSLADARAEFERWLIRRALYEEEWNQTRAAGRLGLSRAGLFKKMRKLGLVSHEE
jgi:transcriptional regulator with AAA-type ATPase domain/pSer/pThr/pTyr-binding forkhead associated (FHA) protein